MKLTSIERNSLLAAQLRADAPIADIAKRSGHREHVVRRALQQLEHKGVIRRYVFVDVLALGMKSYTLMFSFSGSSVERSKVVAFLHNSPFVCWLNETTGEFQYVACLAVRRSKEVTILLDALSLTFGQKIHQKALCERINGTLYPRQYLATKPLKDSPLHSEQHGAPVSIDSTDHSILSALCNRPYRSYSELARSLGMPATTLNHRMAQLKKAKVIVGTCFAVNPWAFSYESYYFLVFTKGIDGKSRAKLRQYFAQHPNVFSCIETLGSWDMEFGAELPDASSATELVGELYEAFPQFIQAVKVFPLSERSSKSSFYPFIDPASES